MVVYRVVMLLAQTPLFYDEAYYLAGLRNLLWLFSKPYGASSIADDHCLRQQLGCAIKQSAFLRGRRHFVWRTSLLWFDEKSAAWRAAYS